MSRSNPTNTTPNPATKWIEWGGADGTLSYYDKEKKEKVVIPQPFTFLVLDELSTVKGWHDPSESGIFSNEVRDTRAEVMVVKSFKGGILAEGLYKDIKDKIVAAGGHYVSNIYIGLRDGPTLVIGALSFKGAALSAWMDFKKSNRDLYKGAISIVGYGEGKKGKVSFRYPTFVTAPVKDETNEEACNLDVQLQEYLGAYFSRTTVQRAAGVASTHSEDGNWLDEDERLSSPGPGERNGDPEEIEPF